MKDNFTYEIKEVNSIPIIYFYGEIGSESDLQVKESYENIKGKLKDRLIINFENVSYINSAGIASLINVIAEASKSKIKVFFVGLSDYFKKVMDIVGVTEFVTLKDKNEEAME